MKFSHKTLNLPVHPGDTIYSPDEGDGWRIKPHTVKMVCLTENNLYIQWRESDLDIDDCFNTDWFSTEEEAMKWAEINRPAPPYEYCYDAKSWMGTDMWIPCGSTWCYIRVLGFICRAYYNRQRFPNGFYESDEPDACRIEGVEAWLDGVYSVNQALQARDYKP